MFLRAAILLIPCLAFYFPAQKYHEFEQGDTIKLYLNSLRSPRSPIPYNYEDLGTCEPEENQPEQSQNLGQILTGQLLLKSRYDIEMLRTTTLTSLCKVNASDTEYEWFISHGYMASFQIDNLPAGIRQTQQDQTVSDFYTYRFPIGNEYKIYNHHNFIIKIANSTEGRYFIVGFLVEPISLKSVLSQQLKEKLLESWPNEQNPQELSGQIEFTYSVFFEFDPTAVDHRWDHYFNDHDKDVGVHWLSIINSLIFITFLSYMIACIIKRSVSRDIRAYQSDSESDFGWKQVSGEVFRPPTRAPTFWVIVGSGIQLLIMTGIILFFALLGFLTPNHRGLLLKTGIILYFALSFYSGYITARFFKKCGGTQWSFVPIGLVILVPGASALVFIVIEIVLSLKGSSESVGFGSIFELLFLWVAVSLPLTYIGSRFGFKKQEMDVPCRINRIPRPTVNSPIISSLRKFCLICGLLPFGSILIELNFIMKSIWHSDYIYFFFGFLFLTFLLFIVITGEVSILMTYILLSKEDGRWWWISVASAGSSGIFLFGYAVLYQISELHIIGVAGLIVYFGYMLLASFYVMLIGGAIGLLASFFFIRQIYTMIKSD